MIFEKKKSILMNVVLEVIIVIPMQLVSIQMEALLVFVTMVIQEMELVV